MIDVMIEVGRGQRVKRCMDAAGIVTGVRTALEPYPYSYGFVLGTVDGEGDGIDCWVISRETHAPGATIRCEPFGLLEFHEGSELDHKVLATPIGNPWLGDTSALRDELEAYTRLLFSAYPEVSIRIGRILPAREADSLIASSRKPG